MTFFLPLVGQIKGHQRPPLAQFWACLAYKVVRELIYINVIKAVLQRRQEPPHHHNHLN